MSARVAVTAAYAAQGFGYALVVTSLPALKERQQVDDLVVTLVVLGVCATAAAGSVLADLIAVRRGSRVALVAGLAAQVVAFAVIALPAPPVVFFLGFALYGLGLGCVDASSAMQGVILQRASGTPLLGGFFAGYTAAAIAGALVVSALAAGASSPATQAGLALLVGAAVALAVALAGVRAFSPERAAVASPGERRADPLPRRAIWVFGAVILVAFTADSAVSTWSTVYLRDDLGAAAWLAPLGYGAYQVAVLVTRLATDRLVARIGARRLAAGAIVVAAIGCGVVALIPHPIGAVAGFALAGTAAGALVPLAFGGAGAADPARSDEIVARVNIFNYAGAVAGAVAVGALAEGPGLAVAFLIPAVALLAVLAAVRAFAPRERGRTASAR